jgi:flagellar FliJ protein
MRWADQLIKLSNFELELLQTRLADVVERRNRAELKLVVLTAEGEAELALARRDPEAAWRLAAFREGLKIRKAAAQREIDLVVTEESGVRDALTEAFETLKKYEHVAEASRIAIVRETARRENAVLDEMGLRRAAGRR